MKKFDIGDRVVFTSYHEVVRRSYNQLYGKTGTVIGYFGSHVKWLVDGDASIDWWHSAESQLELDKNSVVKEIIKDLI